MKSRLELLLALPTTIVISLLLVISVIAEVWLEEKQSEESLREQAYILSQEMQAAWDFISVNQDRINTDGDGTYTFKGLHCSIVGTSIGALFTNRTDYVIRYVSDKPRNKRNAPDEFELEAIAFFRENPTSGDYYDFGTLKDNQDYYRYAIPLTMSSGCVDCHGEPKGEIDVTGFAKEGMQKGDLVGIASISIPVGIYQENLTSRIIQRTLLSGGTLAACLLTIILVTKRYVIRPLRKVESAVKAIGSGNLNTKIQPKAINACGEIQTLTKHFNNMTEELNALHGNLEKIVETRTEQLAEANNVLAQQTQKLEEMNKRLEANDLYKSHFFTMMSHELRTPITALRAYIGMLTDTDTIDSESRNNAIRAIQANTYSLSKLVDNILETSRMEAGSVKLEKTTVDAPDMMNELAKTLEPLAADKAISLTISNGEEVPLFMADENKLLHIVENLGSNAIKYTNKGGAVFVDIALHRENNTICFVVSDNGIGISKEDQKIVFEKFTQGGNSVARPVSGSGLGLALAKEYAELHGGTIILESELGAGSTFTVCLPFEEPHFEEEYDSVSKCEPTKE